MAGLSAALLSFVGLCNATALLPRMFRLVLLLVLAATLLATAMSVLRVLILFLNHCENLHGSLFPSLVRFIREAVGCHREELQRGLKANTFERWTNHCS